MGTGHDDVVYSRDVQHPWIIETTRSLSLAKEYASLFAEWLKLEDGPKRICDAGCGTGTVLRWLAIHYPGLSGIGIDKDEEYARKASQSARDEGLADRLDFAAGDIQSLKLQDDSVDAWFSHAVMHIVPNARVALQEAQRVVKSGGRVVVMTPLDEAPHPSVAEGFPGASEIERLEGLVLAPVQSKLDAAFGGESSLSWQNMLQLMESAGLVVVGVKGLFMPVDVEALDEQSYAEYVDRETDVLCEYAMKNGPATRDALGLAELYKSRRDWLLEQHRSGRRAYGWSGVPLLVAVAEVR